MLTEFSYTNANINWFYEGKKIEKKLNNIIDAVVDEQGYVKVETGINFITQAGYFYDYYGNILIRYDLEAGEVEWAKNKLVFSELVQVGYFPSKNVTLIIYENGQKLSALDSEGNKIFELDSPKEFSLQYFQEFPNYVAIVGDGEENQADKYGRTQFNFKLDFETKKFVKLGLA
ncbi:MAG: hypothetical protein LBI13_07555 [Streptococcaceae bacterium]|nr:hypothetical protein [Streptococcaceae bacterium]